MGLNLLVEPQPLNSAPVLSFLIFSWKLEQSTDLALKQIEMLEVVETAAGVLCSSLAAVLTEGVTLDKVLNHSKPVAVNQ